MEQHVARSAGAAESRFYIDLGRDHRGDRAVVARALAQVLGLFGGGPGDREKAQVLILRDYADCEAALKSGRRVLHAGIEKTDGPWEVLRRQFPEHYRFVHLMHDGGLVSCVAALAELKPPGQPARPSAGSEALDLPDGLRSSRLQGKRIWVLDDNEKNRRSALAQFGAANEVTAFASYEETLKRLSSRRDLPEILLTDLLLPAERFTLGSRAQQLHLGSEFPAGVFVALAAARAGVPLVAVVTDASHHDHPATAAIDFLAWGEPIKIESSRVLLVAARTSAGVKDWVCAIEPGA